MKKFNLLPFLGLLAGFSSAFLGIGGGIVIVPGLIFFGYQIKKAIAASLAIIVPTAFAGVVAHYIIESANVKFFIAFLILIGSIVGAKFGAEIANKTRSAILFRLFAFLLLFAGLKLVNIINIPMETISDITACPLFLLPVLGLAAGSMSGLFGIGAGVVLVPTLNLFFGLSIHQAIATSLVVILPTAFAGALFHKKFNPIDFPTIKFLIPTVLLGAVLGAVAANSLPASSLKIIFGIFMILCSIKFFKSG